MAESAVAAGTVWAQRFFRSTKGRHTAVVFVVIVVGLASLFSFQASSIKVGPVDPSAGRGPGGDEVPLLANLTTPGSASEAETVDQELTIEQPKVVAVTFRLLWTDEPDGARHTNQPDSFSLSVTAPTGETEAGSGDNPPGGEGSIEVTFSRDLDAPKVKPEQWDGRGWNVSITLDAAGDQEPSLGPSIFGFRTQPDNGNAYELLVEYTYMGPPPEK